jgi:glucose/mannose transport system substrate-binding protein
VSVDERSVNVSQSKWTLPGAETVTSRRTLLKGVIVGAGALSLPQILAACGGDDDDDSSATTGAPATTAPSGSTTPGGEVTSTELEVFSWWTGGGEAAGLDAMIEIWNREHPKTKFVNAAVAGGAGSNAKAVLAQRLEANDPPDSFQGHAGQELSDYIKAGQVEPLNEYYDEWGLNDVFPKDLVDQITVNGSVYSVPVNIHRANVLWSNPALVEAAGITGEMASFDDFVAALDKAKASGKTALALAEQWTVKHLMETIMISKLGAEAWAALWTAAGDWTTAEVTGALEAFKKIFDYVNDDYASLTWQDAAKRVVDGEAVYNIMGDWADGYLGRRLLHRAEEDPAHRLRVAGRTGHEGRVRLAVRQLHQAEGRATPGCHGRVARALRQQGRPGRVQPGEGLDPRPQGR